MGLFGWSYPPGAAGDPYAPYNQQSAPCLVCGLFDDKCICPECPECSSIGDPECYKHHGLQLTEAQTQSLLKQEAEWKADAEREAAFWEKFEKEHPEEL